jgi:hypothetical protein
MFLLNGMVEVGSSGLTIMMRGDTIVMTAVRKPATVAA